MKYFNKNTAVNAVIISALLALSHCSIFKEDFYAKNKKLIAILNQHDNNENSINRYVVRSNDGYLFYLEDIRTAVIKWHLNQAKVDSLINLKKYLQTRGIQLLVVPVPTNVEIYHQKLTGIFSGDICLAKSFFFKKLDANNVHYLDLRQLYYKNKDLVPLYPKTDTHWAQPGIIICANLMASELEMYRDKNSLQYVRRDSLLVNYIGDLKEKFCPECKIYDTLPITQISLKDGRLFQEPKSSPVAIIGDSFTNMFKAQNAHLGAHLSYNLNTGVKTFYSVGGYEMVLKRAKKIAEKMTNIRSIILVFTSRALAENPN